MSHFSVAVFHKKGQSIDELLAPYDENIVVAPYVLFTRQQAIDHIRQYDYVDDGVTDEECWKIVAEGNETDKDGNIYSTYNPKAKWDWWLVGGRFHNIITVGAKKADSAKVKDIDFSPNQDAYKWALKEWDVWVDKKPVDPEEYSFQKYSRELLIKAYGDQETYARNQAQFHTYAVITPNGVWHSVGKMGWWGLSSETAQEARNWNDHYKERFIDTADPEWILTIVDCHI